MSDNKLVQDWFKYAENDLVSAQHLFHGVHPKQTEIVCSLSQQCAEKALKGYLFFKGAEPRRTHNLVELCQTCMIHDNAFSQILDACADLTPYGVAARYPNELAIDDILAKSAIDAAKVVYGFCAEKVLASPNEV